MILISKEIKNIEFGHIDPLDNPLKRAPHTLGAVTSDDWNRPYTRAEGGFPLAEQHKNKFWPAVSRIDNVFGDRNLVCSCTAFEELMEL